MIDNNFQSRNLDKAGVYSFILGLVMYFISSDVGQCGQVAPGIENVSDGVL